VQRMEPDLIRRYETSDVSSFVFGSLPNLKGLVKSRPTGSFLGWIRSHASFYA